MEIIGLFLIILIIYYAIKNSKPSGKAERFLGHTLSILKVENNGIISLHISRENFSRGLEEYYSVLQKVFDSETVEERKSDLSPSKVLSNIFFDHTGLYDALVSLCGEINYVESGSGWINYKKCLIAALSHGSVSKINNKDDDIRIKFDSNLYLDANKDTYDYESEFPDYHWNVQVYFQGAEVLCCYGIPNLTMDSKPKKESVLLSTFKPDYWIIKIRKVARKYSENIESMKLEEATIKNRASLFR